MGHPGIVTRWPVMQRLAVVMAVLLVLTKSQDDQRLGFADTLRSLFDGQNGISYEQLKNAAVNFIGSGNSTVVQGLRDMVLGKTTDAQLGNKIEDVKENLSEKGKSALEQIMSFLGDSNHSDSFVHDMVRRVLGQQSGQDQSMLNQLLFGK